MTKIPQLETDRLFLREHRESDLPRCAAMWSDPAVVRYIGGRPLTEEEVWARILRYVGHWEFKGFGYWVLEEKNTGRFVGEVGFADFKRTMNPPLNGVPELGWVLASWAHGQGFATEALRSVLEWAHAQIDTDRIICLIHPENAPSIRVASKLGFQQHDTCLYKGERVLLYQRSMLNFVSHAGNLSDVNPST